MVEDPEGESSGLRLRLAILVDGDNAQPQMLDRIMKEVSRYGNPLVRRIYGDWASGRLGGWTQGLHEFAFEAAQQHSYVSGKNATDSRLIIDAMDLLHSAPMEGFCIVSSDSDYTALAKRLRAGGKWVLGIGERKTPQSFVAACDQFTHTDLLGKPVSPKASSRAQPRTSTGGDKELLQTLRDAFEAMEREDGFANLSQVAQWLRQRKADFDPRNYGRSTLSRLFKLFPNDFEFRRVNGQEDFRFVRRADDAER